MFELQKSWQKVLGQELEKDYFLKLKNLLENDYQTKNIYPKKEYVFNAFNLTNFESVKVVIIGQDPYHQKGQAHGFSFSVLETTKIPPSLKNIFKELKADLNCYIPNNGNLTKWAKQGVLLLNTALTVEDSLPNSHKNFGWQEFTLSVIKKLNDREESVVFLLWGANAKAYEQFINKNKHFVLSSAHPSPLSAYNGFLGCKHFSKTNELLKLQKKEPIDWQIENI